MSKTEGLSASLPFRFLLKFSWASIDPSTRQESRQVPSRGILDARWSYKSRALGNNRLASFESRNRISNRTGSEKHFFNEFLMSSFLSLKRTNLKVKRSIDAAFFLQQNCPVENQRRIFSRDFIRGLYGTMRYMYSGRNFRTLILSLSISTHTKSLVLSLGSKRYSFFNYSFTRIDFAWKIRGVSGCRCIDNLRDCIMKSMFRFV